MQTDIELADELFDKTWESIRSLDKTVVGTSFRGDDGNVKSAGEWDLLVEKPFQLEIINRPAQPLRFGVIWKFDSKVKDPGMNHTDYWTSVDLLVDERYNFDNLIRIAKILQPRFWAWSTVVIS